MRFEFCRNRALRGVFRGKDVLFRHLRLAVGFIVLAIAALQMGCHSPDTESPPDAPVVPSDQDGTPPAGGGLDRPDDEDRAEKPLEKIPARLVAEGETTGEANAGATPPAGTRWGHLRGRIVFDGTPPEQRPVAVTSDVEYCSRHRPLDESLIVNPDNRGLSNVLVSLFLGRGDAAPTVHPSYAATANDTVAIDNLKCRFDPHVVLLRTSQTLRILNTDQIAHNTKIDTLVNTPVNPTLPAGGSLSRVFPLPERLPARMSCSIHPWMCAWVLIRSDPYFAKTDRDGRFEIRNVPTGARTFQAWHEKARYVTEVTLDGRQTRWPKGRFTAEIPPDGTADLGDVHIAPEMFGDP